MHLFVALLATFCYVWQWWLSLGWVIFEFSVSCDCNVQSLNHTFYCSYCIWGQIWWRLRWWLVSLPYHFIIFLHPVAHDFPCGSFPGWCVDVAGFRVSFTDILESLCWSACGSWSICCITTAFTHYMNLFMELLITFTHYSLKLHLFITFTYWTHSLYSSLFLLMHLLNNLLITFTHSFISSLHSIYHDIYTLHLLVSRSIDHLYVYWLFPEASTITIISPLYLGQ